MWSFALFYFYIGDHDDDDKKKRTFCEIYFIFFFFFIFEKNELKRLFRRLRRCDFIHFIPFWALKTVYITRRFSAYDSNERSCHSQEENLLKNWLLCAHTAYSPYYMRDSSLKNEKAKKKLHQCKKGKSRILWTGHLSVPGGLFYIFILLLVVSRWAICVCHCIYEALFARLLIWSLCSRNTFAQQNYARTQLARNKLPRDSIYIHTFGSQSAHRAPSERDFCKYLFLRMHECVLCMACTDKRDVTPNDFDLFVIGFSSVFQFIFFFASLNA